LVKVLHDFSLQKHWEIMTYQKPAEKFLYFILFIQGLYYLVNGFWPIIHIKSFMVVTDPKEDLWLVKTFGMFIAVGGISMIVGALQGKFNKPLFTLAILGAMGFIVFEVYYVWTHVISRIYLADATFQFILLLLWVMTFLQLNKPRKIRY
jgi:hypothetical protein